MGFQRLPKAFVAIVMVLAAQVVTTSAVDPLEAKASAFLRRLTQQVARAAAAAAPKATVPARPPQPQGNSPVACDISGASQQPDVSKCTFVIANEAAARQLLLGTAAAAAARNATYKAAPLGAAGGPPLPRVFVAAQSRAPPRAGGAAGLLQKQPPPPPLFHEAAVWLRGFPGPHTVLFTSNRLGDLSTPNQSVSLTLVDPTGAAAPKPVPRPSPPDAAPMANGGTLVPGTGGAVVLIDYQGQGRRGGGLAALNVATGEVKDVVSRVGAGGGRFSSPNDVVIVPLPSRAQPAGANATSGRYAVALFSDPAYGFDQQFRTGEPDVGEYVWAVTLRLPPTPGPGPATASAARRRWWPEAVGPARVVAGGFVRPNGLAISPDRRTAYISDTGYVSGGGTVSNGLIDTAMVGPPLRTWSSRPAAVYAFDLVFAGASPPSVVLDNRRMFAVADVGAPDGLHCDADGRLWSGEGDGVSAYEPDTGRLLLRVRPGAGGGARAEGVANFAIVGGGAGGGGLLVMGQEQAATAVRLPGLRAFNIDLWLD